MRKVESIDREIAKWNESIEEANTHIERLSAIKKEIIGLSGDLREFTHKCYEVSDGECVCIIDPLNMYGGRSDCQFATLHAAVVVVTKYDDGTYSIAEDPDYAISLVYLDTDSMEYVQTPEITSGEFMKFYGRAKESFDSMLVFKTV